MQEPRYLNDNRYPGPSTHPPPAQVKGLPTQAELDAYPRMFTWGELKTIIQSGDLEQLMRNKEMQGKYDQWSAGIKEEYGSTENYLTRARLPWAQSTPQTPRPTYPSGAQTSASATDASSTSRVAQSTPSGRSAAVSGASTPSSAGFVSLDTLKDVLGKHKKASRPVGSGGASCADGPEENIPDYLRYDPAGLDSSRYAVLFNDWPYNSPYGVRHYCVWSRVPIAHPHLVDYDPDAWALIESEGLGGFTGVTPTSEDIFGDGGNTSRDASSGPAPLPRPLARAIPPKNKDEWYSVDCAFGGTELRRWVGVQYQSAGGQEVGKMVKSLWDERGWECLFFVNPPRLQSVPGFSHFHVFARRKTPEEIDAGEAVWGKPE